MSTDARGLDKAPFSPYTLIYSASQHDLEACGHIDATVKTDFSSANWAQIRCSFKTYHERNPKGVHPVILFILDQKSTEDRKVIIMHESMPGWFTPEVNYAWPESMEETEGLVGMSVWKKYRVPFEEAWTAHCAIEGCCSLEHAESYFEKEILGDVLPGERESQNEAEEIDSDETTSEDLEYMTNEQLKRLEPR
jgi:hypothetical protein